MYIYIFSGQSDAIYPTNRPWAFTAQLPQPLQLSAQHYECALREITVQADPALLRCKCLINADIVTPARCFNSNSATLRSLNIDVTDESGQNIIFDSPYYSKLSKNCAAEIRIAISPCPGQSATDLHHKLSKAWLVLHIRPIKPSRHGAAQ